jgi:hypothetical protein
MEGHSTARDSAQQKIDDAAGQAKDAAGQATEQAKQTAGQATEKARKSLQEQVDRRSTEAGEQVGSTARDMRSVAEQLRSQGKEKPAQLADQAADQVERVGGYLRDSDADKLLRDIEDFGRRQPWVVVVGGLALGFAASRFLKASSSRRYEQSTRRSGPQVGDASPSQAALDSGTAVPTSAVTAEPPTTVPVVGGGPDA